MLSVPAIARPQETATTANERIKTVTQKFGNTFPVRNPTKSPRYCQPTGGWDFNRGFLFGACASVEKPSQLKDYPRAFT